MGYVDDLLANNEQVIYTTRKHWVAPLVNTVSGSLATLGAIVALVWALFLEPGWLRTLLVWGGVAALIVGLFLLARAFVIWLSQLYLVTNQKVMLVSGVLRKKAEGSALEKITDITIEQPLLGRWLDYGTVRVLTAADESNRRYRVMREPMAFRKTILDQKQAFELGQSRDIVEAVRSTQAGAPVAAAPQSTDEITEVIAKLAALRDSGAITSEEFEAKKAELLGRI